MTKERDRQFAGRTENVSFSCAGRSVPPAYSRIRQDIYNCDKKRRTKAKGRQALQAQNLYRTAAYVTAFSVAEKAFGFLYRIILSRTLGSEGMGIYQIALSVFAVLITAASSGIPLTVSRLITKYRAKNNKKAQQSVVTAALVCALLFSVPVFCVLFFAHDAFDFLFSDPRCMAVLLVLLPSLTFNSVYAVIRGALWGNKQFIPYCVIDLAEELVMIGAGIVLVTAMTDVFDGAKRAALAVVLSYLVSFTMAGIWYFAKGGRLKDPRRQLKPLLASALPITGMRTSNSLVNSAISLLLPARLIAAGFTSSEAMSEIGVATGMSMPVLSIPATLIGSLALVLVPELAENFYRGQHEKMRENIERAIKVTVLVACLLIPTLFVLGEDIGILLFSNVHGGHIIRNSCLMLLPMSLSMISTGILNSLGCEKQSCSFFFAGAAATLLCVWFLPQVAGVYALLIGMTASYLLTMFLNLRLILKKCREKPHFLKHALCTAATLPPVILFGVLLRRMLGSLLPDLAAIGLCFVLLAAVQALFLYALGLIKPRWVTVFLRRKQPAPHRHISPRR